MADSNFEIIDKTVAVWRVRTSRALSPDDAQQIITNMTGLFRVLDEWNRSKVTELDLVPLVGGTD